MEKKNNKQIIVIVVLVTLLSITLIGASYAYFLARIEGKGEEFTITSGSMSLIFHDKDENNIGKNNMIPTEYVTKNFSVENDGTLPVTYNIKLVDIETTFKGHELKYTLQETDETYKIPKENVKAEEGYISIGTASSGVIYILVGDKIVAKQGEDQPSIKYFKLTIEFEETGEESRL